MTNKILSKNPSFIAQKLLSIAFKGYTTDFDVTSWINGTLAPYIANDIQLVVVQLGDNVNTAAKLN